MSVLAKVGKTNLTLHFDANNSNRDFLAKSVNDEVAAWENLANPTFSLIRTNQSLQPFHAVDSDGCRFMNFPDSPTVTRSFQLGLTSPISTAASTRLFNFLKPPFDLYLVAFASKKAVTATYTTSGRSTILVNRATPVAGSSIGTMITCFQASAYPRLQCFFWNDKYEAVNAITPNTEAGLNYDEKFLLRFTAVSAKLGMRVSTNRLPNLLEATVATPAGSTTNTSFPYTPCIGNNNDNWLGGAFAGGIYELAVFNRELNAKEDYTVTNYFKRKHDL